MKQETSCKQIPPPILTLFLQILLSSLVFLLTQPDGALRPKRNYLFVAPCLMWAIFFLYIVAITSVLPFFSQPQRMQSLFAAGMCTLMWVCVYLNVGMCVP